MLVKYIYKIVTIYCNFCVKCNTDSEIENFRRIFDCGRRFEVLQNKQFNKSTPRQ